MGRSWFSVVNKAISCGVKEKNEQKTEKPKRRWFGINKSKDSVKSSNFTRPSIVEVKSYETKEQNRRALVMATSAAAKAAFSAAQAAAEVVRLAIATRTVGISSEESAAIKIQTAFRAYMARRALRALRGLVRLKSLVQGEYVKGQATVMLRSMQTLTRIQSQVREQRSRTLGKNKALMQQKEEKEPQKIGEGWDDSTKSKEEVEDKLLSRKEAASRREKALAYAYSHQTWRSSSKNSRQEPEDSSKLYKGWSWLERWMATHPWETKSVLEDNNLENKSVKDLTPYDAKSNPIPKPPKKTRRESSEATKGGRRGNNDMGGILSEKCNKRQSLHVGLSSSGNDKESHRSSSQSTPLRSYATGEHPAKLRASLSTPSRLGPREKEIAGPSKKRLSASKSATLMKRRLSDPAKGTANGQTRKNEETVKADKQDRKDNPKSLT